MFAEGSDDELELTAQHLQIDEDETDAAAEKMIPSQNETPATDFTEFYNNNAKELRELAGSGLSISLKPVEHRERDHPKLRGNHHDHVQGNPYAATSNGFKAGDDLAFLRAREFVLNTGCLPLEMEAREAGVFAKCNISRGLKYGPFHGKWAGVPQDVRFAWEVSIGMLLPFAL